MCEVRDGVPVAFTLDGRDYEVRLDPATGQPVRNKKFLTSPEGLVAWGRYQQRLQKQAERSSNDGN